MSGSQRNKLKLVYLLEILLLDSDEEHPICTQDLLDFLAGRGVSCDRRTLAMDIKMLNENGYEIMSVMCGHQKGYYIAERLFAIAELRILMDAVQGAGFITPKKTQILLDKLAILGGRVGGSALRQNLVDFNTRKHTNETIYYTIDTIERAFSNNRQISFQYYHLDENRKRIYSKDNGRYTVHPVSLVFCSDRYYLMAIPVGQTQMRSYRVDRMEKVIMEKEAAQASVREARTEVAEFTGSAIRMYSGINETVSIEFDDGLIGAIYDRFGETIPIYRIDENLCRAEINVLVSPTFWGWLFQFGDKLRPTGPEHVVNEYKNRLQAMLCALDS